MACSIVHARREAPDTRSCFTIWYPSYCHRPFAPDYRWFDQRQIEATLMGKIDSEEEGAGDKASKASGPGAEGGAAADAAQQSNLPRALTDIDKFLESV